MKEQLDLKMYFFVPYNISDKQIGIQAGHSALRYARKFGAGDENAWVWDFVDNHETWIILDGGTTNNSLDHPGSLQEIYRSIINYNDSINFSSGKLSISSFYEPDLNDTLTSFCFIVDERVWNYDDFISFKKYFMDLPSVFGRNKSIDNKLSYDELKNNYPKIHKKWTDEIMGDEKNVFIRELLTGKKLA